MTRVRSMSKAERAAMVDALRHMRSTGARHAELVRVAGTKVRSIYGSSRAAKATRP